MTSRLPKVGFPEKISSLKSFLSFFLRDLENLFTFTFLLSLFYKQVTFSRRKRERGNEGKKDKERERMRDVVGREEVKKERISG